MLLGKIFKRKHVHVGYCKLCGGKPIIHSPSDDYTGELYLYAECSKCGMRLTVHQNEIREEILQELSERLIRRWNGEGLRYDET